MTRFTCLTSQRLQKNKQARVPKVSNWQTIFSYGPKLNLGLLLILIGFGWGYIHLANQSAAANFRLHELNKQLTSMKEQHQILQLHATETQSLQQLSVITSQRSDLVPITSVKYISNNNAAVALSN